MLGSNDQKYNMQNVIPPKGGLQPGFFQTVSGEGLGCLPLCVTQLISVWDTLSSHLCKCLEPFLTLLLCPSCEERKHSDESQLSETNAINLFYYLENLKTFQQNHHCVCVLFCFFFPVILKKRGKERERASELTWFPQLNSTNHVWTSVKMTGKPFRKNFNLACLEKHKEALWH